jgi:hypothetical protein
MKNLIQLAKFLKKERLRVNILDGSERNKAISKIWKEIIKGSIEDVSDIENMFFKESSNAGAYARKAKSRLLNTLYDSVHLISTNTWSEVQQNYAHCYNRLAVFKTLVAKRQTTAALSLGEYLIHKSKHYEITEIGLSVSRDLQLMSIYLGDKGAVLKFQKTVTALNEINNAEIKAETYFSTLYSYFIGNRIPDQDFIESANSLLRELEPLHKKHISFRLNFRYFSIKSLVELLNQNYTAVVKNCQEAINFFESKKFEMPYVAFYHFYLQMVPAFLYLREFEAVEGLIEKALNHKHAEVGAYLHHCIFAFHADNYKLANTIYEKGSSVSAINFNIETWKIIGGYLQILSNLGRIDFSGDITAARFRNDFELFSKDKKGANAQIIAIWFLLALTEGKRGVLIDSFDAIRIYKKRHLSGS